MINAVFVKQLREKSGAGMMDCKKALVETQGDLEKAVDWLKTKGLSAAAKKANRIAVEGVTALKVKDQVGAIIEMNSETDFVARNEKFQKLVENIAELALHYNDLKSLKLAKTPAGKTVQEEIVYNIATLGENLNLRRMSILTISQGIIVSYVHNAVTTNQGKISVVVGLESIATDKSKLLELGRKIAIHIAASNPYAVDKESLDPLLIEREKNIFFEQSKNSGKPSNIMEKMVEGRIQKFLAEVVLLEQSFLFDNKLTISTVIQNAEKELLAPITITKFIRYEVGEGLLEEEKNN